MDRPAGPVLRWVRACLLAAVSVALAVGAHASAGGAVPAPTALAVVFVASAAVAAALLGRPASPLRVAGLLVAGQAFVHVWLTVTSTPAAHAGMASMAHHPAMAGSGVPSPGLAAMGVHMVVAHLLAAAGVGLWLALGERALWTVLGLTAGGVRDLIRLHRAVRGGLPIAAPVVLDLLTHGPAAVTDRSAHLVRRQAVLCRSLARRGPPVLGSA